MSEPTVTSVGGADVLEQMRQEIAALRQQVAAQTPVIVPDAFTRAPEYDDRDDAGPMIVFNERQADGTFLRHRVRVADWPAYEARFGF